MAGYSNQKVFILYEDEHLLVVKKPFGMESQRGKSFAMDQESLLRGYLSSKTKTDNPYLAVVHRLDRPVAGVMVYAKTKKAAADLSAQLQTENFSKKYEAVVSGIVPACEGRLEDYLTADKRTGTTSVSSKADPLAKKAVLTWKEIAREEVKSGEILLPYASNPSPEGGWHFCLLCLRRGVITRFVHSFLMLVCLLQQMCVIAVQRCMDHAVQSLYVQHNCHFDIR